MTYENSVGRDEEVLQIDNGHFSSMKSRGSMRTEGSSAHRWPWLARMVKSQKFDVFVGTVILCNCASMSVEVEVLMGRMYGWKPFLDVSEHVYTALFLIEAALRLLVFGWRYYVPGLGGSFANFGDLCIVIITGVGAVWILPLFDVDNSEALQTITVLRALRLVRMVRVVSRIELFHEVWLLLRGLSDSMRVLFWTVVVIFFITYVFAIFGVVIMSTEIKKELETATSESELAALSSLLGKIDGILPLMFTLLQVLTLDSWTELVRNTMEYVPWCWMYYYLFVAIVVFVLMNLVTAIIVENALANSKKDEEAVVAEKDREKHVALQNIKVLFQMIDIDGNGVLTRNEFESAFEDPEIAMKLKMLDIQPKHCQEIFNLLDSGDGVLSLEEFFEGITAMEGLAQSKDLFKVMKTTEHLARRIRRYQSDLSHRAQDTSNAGRQPVSQQDAVLMKLNEVMEAVSTCNKKVDMLSREVSDLKRR